MISNIKLILGIVLGIALVVLIIINFYPTLTNVSVRNSSIAFAANDTYYNIGNPIYTDAPYTPSLTYANGTTAVSNYSYTASQVKIGSNIAPGTYYGHYTYYNKSWIGGTDYTWVIGLVIFIAGIASVLKFLDYI